MLPRTHVSWLADRRCGCSRRIPGRRSDSGSPTAGRRRPPNVVALADVEGDYGGIVKHLGAAAGAQQTGLNWVALPPNEEGAPPHCHSADEEVFVILDGEGTLELWGPPQPGGPMQTAPRETHRVRRGHVDLAAARGPASRTASERRRGLTYLAYGTREPNDMCYYPRSNKVFFRGLGVIARLELLDYGDGEPG